MHGGRHEILNQVQTLRDYKIRVRSTGPAAQNRLSLDFSVVDLEFPVFCDKENGKNSQFHRIQEENVIHRISQKIWNLMEKISKYKIYG